MKRVAVTGGAGFIGSNLVRRLLSEGFDVRVLDDFSTGLRSNLRGLDCEVVEVSLTDDKGIRQHLKSVETIFHIGARGSVPRSIKNPQATFNVNVVGTLNVLDAARENGSRVIFSSSSSVYGRNNELPKHEECWTAPLTPYAASKLSGEALVQGYSESFGIPAITFRFFNIFGPWQRPDHDYAAVIPKWIWKALRNEPIQVFGDGNHTRDFTYVDTVLDVLLDALKRNVSHPVPVNLAFGNSISLNELIVELKNYFPSLDVAYAQERKGDVKASQNNPALLQKLFPGVIPIEFSKGLSATRDWLIEHGEEVAGQTIDQS